MKFKDWFLSLNPEVIEANPFKCIGWCEKFFFYVDKNCPVEKLIEDIKNGWGPANFDVVEIDFGCDGEDMWIITCNDGKCGVTTEWCKSQMEQWRKNGKEEKESLQNMTVFEMISSMTKEERSKLYEALLHIDEVGLLGDGLLRDLFRLILNEKFWTSYNLGKAEEN